MKYIDKLEIAIYQLTKDKEDLEREVQRWQTRAEKAEEDLYFLKLESSRLGR